MALFGAQVAGRMRAAAMGVSSGTAGTEQIQTGNASAIAERKWATSLRYSCYCTSQ